jgi:hypothetical protein
MVLNRFILLAVIGIVMISTVFSAGMNSCGTVGDDMPGKVNDCTSDNKLSVGSRCCYIRAIAVNNTVSACTLLPTGVNISVIHEASKALGANSFYDCDGSNKENTTDLIKTTIILSSILLMSVLLALISHK